MTLEEARKHIRAVVVYDPGHGPLEDGVIVRVNQQFVFVRYASNSVKATPPEKLTLLSALQSTTEVRFKDGPLAGQHRVVMTNQNVLETYGPDGVDVFGNMRTRKYVYVRVSATLFELSQS